MLSLKFVIITTFSSFILVGCFANNVEYFGVEYLQTNNILVYEGDEKVGNEFEAIGEIFISGSGFITGRNLKGKLIKEAKKRGADAILFNPELSYKVTFETTNTKVLGKVSETKIKEKMVSGILFVFKSRLNESKK